MEYRWLSPQCVAHAGSHALCAPRGDKWPTAVFGERPPSRCHNPTPRGTVLRGPSRTLHRLGGAEADARGGAGLARDGDTWGLASNRSGASGTERAAPRGALPSTSRRGRSAPARPAGVSAASGCRDTPAGRRRPRARVRQRGRTRAPAQRAAETSRDAGRRAGPRPEPSPGRPHAPSPPDEGQRSARPPGPSAQQPAAPREETIQLPLMCLQLAYPTPKCFLRCMDNYTGAHCKEVFLPSASTQKKPGLLAASVALAVLPGTYRWSPYCLCR
ncbi:pro-neuregulin-4, membrane-bound isoform [Artibeus jamaicensis]|uniref:pro-neuregulin-4, membrane-bound isoform n=1 Tax=Artibeus jamaicensis TaxID=9417 RepID=UPI00235AD698|nr:pro-neuregulin-4, membrane-bound isoform [Artibeus jamaicensis]